MSDPEEHAGGGMDDLSDLSTDESRARSFDEGAFADGPLDDEPFDDDWMPTFDDEADSHEAPALPSRTTIRTSRLSPISKFSEPSRAIARTAARLLI